MPRGFSDVVDWSALLIVLWRHLDGSCPSWGQKQTSSREGSMSALPLPAQRRTFTKEVHRPCKTRRFQLTGFLSLPFAAESAELKLLQRSPRRGVVMSPCIDQVKPLAERCA